MALASAKATTLASLHENSVKYRKCLLAILWFCSSSLCLLFCLNKRTLLTIAILTGCCNNHDWNLWLEFDILVILYENNFFFSYFVCLIDIIIFRYYRNAVSQQIWPIRGDNTRVRIDLCLHICQELPMEAVCEVFFYYFVCNYYYIDQWSKLGWKTFIWGSIAISISLFAYVCCDI